MNLKGKLRNGLRIFGADNRDYGTIERFDDEYAYVGGRRIPVSAFERMDNDRLYLGAQGRQYFETDDRGMNERETRIPVAEERLTVQKQAVETGSVEVHKGVTSERVDVPVDVTHEQVTINRVDVPDRPVAPGDMSENAFREETIRVPVRGERVTADKETVVTGEVVVDKEARTERQTVGDTVRREVVGVDHDKGVPVQHSDSGLPHWDEVRDQRRQAWEQRSGGSGGRWQDVEAGHHYAHEMSADPRYQGRSWSEVEPELQSGYSDWSRNRGYMADDDGWARLHREVENAWEGSRTTARR